MIISLRDRDKKESCKKEALEIMKKERSIREDLDGLWTG